MDYISIIIQGIIQGLTEFPSRFKLRPSVCCPAFYEYRRKHPYNLCCTAFRNASGGFYSIFPYYLGNDKEFFLTIAIFLSTGKFFVEE